MANNCVIDMTLTFNNEEEATSFAQQMKAKKEIARQEHKGLFMGSDDRYFFDVCIDQYHDSVTLVGWVKWSLSRKDIMDWLDYMQKINPISYMKAYYQEPGFELYGYYELDKDGQLSDVYVEPEDFPDYDDDNFWEDLETLLQTNPSVELLCNIKED